MSCEQCGRELPYLTAVLSQTEAGTQCPNCWARLRRLTGNPEYHWAKDRKSVAANGNAS